MCARALLPGSLCYTESGISADVLSVSTQLVSSQAAEGHPRCVQGPGALLPRQMKVSHHCHPDRLGNSVERDLEQAQTFLIRREPRPLPVGFVHL